MVNYGPTLLKIENLELNYGPKVVLKDINIQIQEAIDPSGEIHGQVIGFLGPSGIGKTSLCRLIAGLDKATSGIIRLNGNDHDVQAGEVGVIAQSYPLFNHRTIKGNLLLAAKRKESNEKAALDKIHTYVNRFNVGHLLHSYPAQLSGGERQRVAIIQQILASSHFLIMDEPFSGLDMISLEEVAKTIKDVAAMDGLNTILIVTHDITSAAAVSDHLWMMGRDRTPTGDIIPGAKIKQVYDLIEAGIAWHPEIITSPLFVEVVRQVKETFRTL